MLSLLSFPEANTIISSSTDYASAWSTEFLPFVYITLGIIASVVLIRFLINVIGGGISRVSGISRDERESVPGSWEASRAMYELHNKK